MQVEAATDLNAAGVEEQPEMVAGGVCWSRGEGEGRSFEVEVDTDSGVFEVELAGDGGVGEVEGVVDTGARSIETVFEMECGKARAGQVTSAKTTPSRKRQFSSWRGAVRPACVKSRRPVMWACCRRRPLGARGVRDEEEARQELSRGLLPRLWNLQYFRAGRRLRHALYGHRP